MLNKVYDDDNVDDEDDDICYEKIRRFTVIS